MKASQKFKISVENITFIVRFAELDKQLEFLVDKLEREGDIFGPCCATIEQNGNILCVSIRYADKSRGPTKSRIFGYDSDKFLAKQYK